MFLVIKKIISDIYESFLDLIYNQKCLICGCSKRNNLLCKNCLKEIDFLSCFAHRFYNKIPIYSAFKYKGNIRKIIHKLKFLHNKNASKVLAILLFEYFKKLNFNKEFIIIYPNSYYLKTFKRGYNPVFLIVKEFSKLSGFCYQKDFIKKIKPTKPQYKAKDRFKNIKDSFKINEKYIDKLKDKNILLIDDITTSGATINEILDKLLEYNLNITCLTVAKT